MSAASAMLEVGRVALVAHHGESFTWIPASAVVRMEHGEVPTSETGLAIPATSETTTFTGNFDGAYAVINTSDGSIASTGPAVTDVSPSDLPNAGRGDIVYRGPIQYTVTETRRDSIGGMVLILSKHAH